MRRRPQVSVVVASEGDLLRLRWLLNSLEEQSLPRESRETIIVHDPGERRVADLVGAHAEGAIAVPARGSTAAKLDAGWGAAGAPLVAFSREGCRPAGDWLQSLLEAARRHPGSVLHGSTLPDPQCAVEWHGPHVETHEVRPGIPGAISNVAYPYVVLERAGGFSAVAADAAPGADLALRAAGFAEIAPAPEAVIFRAPEARSFARALAATARCVALPGLVRRHPGLRKGLPLRMFWSARHAWATAAGLGALAARRHRCALLLVLPWLAVALPFRGRDARGIVRAASELPGELGVDAAEVAVLAVGSMRHRSLLL